MAHQFDEATDEDLSFSPGCIPAPDDAQGEPDPCAPVPKDGDPARRAQPASNGVPGTADGCLEDGLLLVELDSGMFAAVRLSALEGARVITGKQVFSDEERAEIDDGSIDMDEVARELGDDEEDAPA